MFIIIQSPSHSMSIKCGLNK